jgi:CAAX protease family protein
MSKSVESSRVPARAAALLTDDQFATRLRGFGPIGIVAILIIIAGNELIVPLSAILVLAWARMSNTPWREIGYVRPPNWIRVVIGGAIFGAAFKFVMKALVMPVLGAPPLNQTYHFLAGNTAALPWMLYAIVIGAGFGEETVFRGWLFERFGKLLGRAPWSKVLIILITSVFFAVVHYPDQGLPGVEQAMITGLAFGTIFTTTGSIFLPMVAHIAFDLTALAMIYWNLETAVAHFIFK